MTSNIQGNEIIHINKDLVPKEININEKIKEFFGKEYDPVSENPIEHDIYNFINNIFKEKTIQLTFSLNFSKLHPLNQQAILQLAIDISQANNNFSKDNEFKGLLSYLETRDQLTPLEMSPKFDPKLEEKPSLTMSKVMYVALGAFVGFMSHYIFSRMTTHEYDCSQICAINRTVDPIFDNELPKHNETPSPSNSSIKLDELNISKTQKYAFCNANASEYYIRGQQYVEKEDAIFKDFFRGKNNLLSGVDLLRKNALHFFQLAADQNHIEAHYYAGKMYKDLDDNNIEKAFESFTKAADLGNAFAQYALGELLDRHAWKLCKGNFKKKLELESKKFKYLNNAADQGHRDAQIKLGELYFKKENYINSCQNFRRAIIERSNSDTAYSRLLSYGYIRTKAKDGEITEKKLWEFCAPFNWI